jgi:phospholipid/cholesterol/gamma-HCH transport system substrate-binding protein
MSERSLRLKLGLFVLLALALLGTMVFLFGSLPTWFERVNLYTVRFADAPGVGPGTPVRRSGIRIGSVRAVTLDEEQEIVRVLVAINQRYTIRRNEQATLISGLIGSDAVIDFIPQPAEEGKPPDRTPLEPGAEVVGVRAATVNTLLNRASEVVPTTQETMNEMRKSLQRLEKMAPLAEDTMREYRDLAREANKAIPDLKRTNDEVRQLARSSRESIPELRRTAEDFAAVSRMWTRVGERADLLLQANQDKLVKAIENVNELLSRMLNVFSEENQRNVTATIRNTRLASDRFDDISRNLDETLKDARKAMNRVNETLNRADAVMSDLQKLTRPLSERGESIAINLDAVLSNTQRITAPLAERADAIARNLDVGLAETRKLIVPFAARSEKLARDLEQSLDKVNRTMDDLNALMRVIDQCDSTLRRILSDPSLYIHLDEAVCGVVRLMPRLDRILKDFETFADKLARHPEALGLGGVVRPSTGLKDPPAPPPVIGPPPGFPP